MKTTGIIHISEISPGRIRNIRDFVKEGKKIICKVLRIYRERGHLDLSLRRVTESQKRQKKTQIKQEMLAERIIEFAAKDLDMTLKDLYKVVIDIVLKETAVSNKAPLSQIKVLPFKEKKEWILSAKYNIGKKIVKENGQDENTEV